MPRPLPVDLPMLVVVTRHREQPTNAQRLARMQARRNATEKEN